MLTNLIRLIKFLILLFFWLVFPPVFYWLAKRWYPHRKDWRRIFFAISPLMVILIFYVLMYTSIFTTDALKGSKWMIENKTEMDFPSYNRNNFRFYTDLVLKNSTNSLHGDHSLSFKARLKPSQCDAFFREIEQSIADTTRAKSYNYGVRDRSWRVDAAGNYSFSYLREQPEEYLRITINPGTYEMEVDFGTW